MTEEAGEEATMEAKDLSPEEAEALLDGAVPETVTEDPDGSSADQPPAWATLPPGLKMPKQGSQVAFMRIPAAWTTDPAAGDRWCACWPIGEVEERLAYSRGGGNVQKSMAELAKATIRVIDGARARWDMKRGAGDVQEFWSTIGPKGRQAVRNYYVKTHTLQEEEVLDFYAKHFAIVTVA